MLPVLFHIGLPAPWLKPVALLLAVGLALGRAALFRRRLRREGEAISFGAALWDDRRFLAGLAAAVAALWGLGLLDGPLDLPVHSYGVAIAVGFVAAVALAQRQARREGLDPERVGDLAFWVLVSALAGSRLYFVLVNWNEYFGSDALVETRLGRLPRLLVLWEGGLVFYGGFIAAALASLWYMRRHRMPFLRYADVVIPSVALGHFFGRLGCFGAGCCFGRASDADLPWLVRFPPGSHAYQALSRAGGALLAPGRLTTAPLHPTQLYEAAGELGLFLVLVLWTRPRRRFAGQLLATWLMGYAVLRTGVELLRGDVERGLVAGLAVGQWTSLAVFAAGAAVWAGGRRAAAPKTSPLPE